MFEVHCCWKKVGLVLGGYDILHCFDIGGD